VVVLRAWYCPADGCEDHSGRFAGVAKLLIVFVGPGESKVAGYPAGSDAILLPDYDAILCFGESDLSHCSFNWQYAI